SVVFAGSAAQAVGGTVKTTFTHVAINEPANGSVNFATSVGVNGTFTLTAGAVILGAHTLTLQGDFINQAGATAFNGIGGTGRLAGSAPQRLGGSAPTTFGQLAAAGPSTLRLETTQVTADSLDVAAAATIDLNGANLATTQVTGSGKITQTTGQGRLVL